MKRRLGIVILNYNSSDFIFENIKSFKEYNKDKFDFTFIIVDNDSKQYDKNKIKNYISKFKSIELFYKKINYNDNFKNYEIIYVEMDKNYGYSFSNNVGIKIVDDLGIDYFILANPDTEIIDEKSIINMYSILENNKSISVVFPNVIDPEGNVQGLNWKRPNMYNLCFYKIFYPILFVPNKIVNTIITNIKDIKYKKYNYTKIYSSIGCFFMGRTEDFIKIGMLDENVFMYSEEHILAERIRNIDKIIVKSKNSKILHKHIFKNNKDTEMQLKWKEDSFNYFLEKYMNYSKNKIKYISISDSIMLNRYSNIRIKIKGERNG
ncbi:glycosyltransferase [Paraclostridium tenue]